MLENKELVLELESGAIVSALLGMFAAGSVPDVSSLADRLEENEQRLLAQVVFDKEARPVTVGEISTYLKALERRSLERQRLFLQKRIREAQRSQNPHLAMELLKQQNELDRRLANLL